MTNELDIYRSAQELVTRHGGDAILVAASRADELLAAGDVQGRRVWLDIMGACEVLLTETAPAGTLLH